MAPGTSIVWFRSNLRLHDNEALEVAAASSHVLPVYVFDRRVFGARSRWFDQEKTGAHRARFIIEAVEDLRRSLRLRGSDLHVAVGKPEELIPDLCRRYGAERVVAPGEVCSEETEVERALAARLAPARAALRLCGDGTLVDGRDLPFAAPRGLPEVFTAFRKAVEERCTVRPPLPAPGRLPPLPVDGEGRPPEPCELPALAFFRLAAPPPAPPAPEGAPPEARFEGGETAGLRRLREYVWEKDLLRGYKETRDEMLGADYSSKFSPWLAAGCLSARQIYAEVKRYEQERVANQSTYWLVFELLWRDFFRFLAAKHGDHLFFRAGIKRTTYRWSEEAAPFEAWVAGRTGVPLVDAAMRELACTGFMSNRARQNVASYLAKDLGLNWQMGAEYFEAALLDYDPAANWGNWQYVAGVGNDPREGRRFNMTKQARTYDPTGAFVKRWLPELRRLPASRVHEPWTLTPEEQAACGLALGVDYPRPLVEPLPFRDPPGGGGGGGGGKYGGPRENRSAFARRTPK